jgi:hypothetical protein
MNKRELLNLWEATHQSLESDPESRDRFLQSEEVPKILDYEDAEIVACVASQKRLIDILARLEEREEARRRENPPERVPYGTLSKHEAVGPTGSSEPRQFSDGAKERHESSAPKIINRRRRK